MKIAILHLSDFHLKSSDRVINEKIKKIVDAFTGIGRVDRCIVVFSGDMTYYGHLEDYKPVRFVFGQLLNYLHEKADDSFIPLLCVPGNHDLVLNDDSRKFSDIRKYYDDGSINSHISDEMKSLSSYFSFAQATNKNWIDGLYSRAFYDYDGFRMQINLINTAPFSTLLPDDKESHYYPKEKLALLRKSDHATVCVTVMHHGLEWFDWSCKYDLEKTIYDHSEFLLTGHDHVVKGKCESFGSDAGVWVSAAGAIDFTRNETADGFNTIVIDTDTNSFSGYQFSWNCEEHLYVHKTVVDGKKLPNKSHRLHPRPSYIKELRTDARHKLSTDFTDYFVFPKLSITSRTDYSETSAITNYDEFIRYVKGRNVCFIYGEPNSGKSTLMNYLYIKLSENAIPLLWDAAALKVSIAKLTKNLFEQQYSEQPLQFERYMQEYIENRYMVVDNWDVIADKQKQEVLDYLTENYGHVILFKNTTYMSEDIDGEEGIESVIAETLGKTNILTIEPFYLKKRKELVQRVCLTSCLLNESDVEKVNNAISLLVQNHTSMFILNPEFIIQYTLYFAKEQSHSYQHGEKIFSKIFEANITSLITDSTTAANVDEYITVLEEIAHFMYRRKADCITLTDTLSVIDAYNTEYTAKVSGRKYIDSMRKAKILCYIGDDCVTFTNKNYLSYFIARYICRDYSNNDNIDDIRECAKLVCFGINSDILLFIIYLTSNMKIVRAVQAMAADLFENNKPLVLGENCSNIFPAGGKDSSVDTIEAPTKEEQQRHVDEVDRHEEARHAGVTIATRGVFDYDSRVYDTDVNRLRRGFAIVELLAKSLPAFSNIMKGEQKGELVDALYLYPRVLLYQVFCPVDDKFTGTCQKFVKISQRMADQKLIQQPLTYDDAEALVRTLSQCILLSSLDCFAECAVDEKTIPLLLRPISDPISEIQKLLFIENSGNTDLLHKEALRILKITKQQYIRAMVKSIVRKHLLTNTTIDFSKRTQIIDTVFGKAARKELRAPMNRAV